MSSIQANHCPLPTNHSDHPCRYGHFGSEAVAAGSRQNVECPHKQTNHCPLTTNHLKIDIGFRVLKLDTSNLAVWDGTPTTDSTTFLDRLHNLESTINPNRTDLDVVFEVMLKMGLELDSVASVITVGSKKCYSIGNKPFETNEDCKLLICLDKGITPDDITAMCDMAPPRLVCAEEAFEDDSALSNAHYIITGRDVEMKLL